jgi:CRP-like cAMP-binding protein
MQNSIKPGAAASIDLSSLQAFCREVRFEPGDALRWKGQHYRDMCLIVDGCVDVDLDAGPAAKLVVSEPGSPIGEIGFLRGCSATATVTARTPTCVLLIDDDTLARLEREQPAVNADLLRRLAETAQERTSFNLTWSTSGAAYLRPQEIEVYLCRTGEMLERAQRLRYEVYCQELGRQSPYADHDKKIISDPLDEAGVTFIAVEAGQTIGTFRGNASRDSSLGVLEELYGMRASPHHPQATSVCTKFIVKKSKRGGAAAMKLICAMVRYGVRTGIKACYIDSIPALLPYYKALGFTIAGQKFFHRENGPSIPMVLDVVRHGDRLSNEFGMREYLNLVMKARVIRFVDRVRAYVTFGAPR